MYLIFEMLSSSKKTEINDSLEMKYSCWVLTLLDIWFEAILLWIAIMIPAFLFFGIH